MNFPVSASTQTQTVTVQVLADAMVEPQESFSQRATASGNIAVYGVGEGTILLPSSVVVDNLFGNGLE